MHKERTVLISTPFGLRQSYGGSLRPSSTSIKNRHSGGPTGGRYRPPTVMTQSVALLATGCAEASVGLLISALQVMQEALSLSYAVQGTLFLNTTNHLLIFKFV